MQIIALAFVFYATALGVMANWHTAFGTKAATTKPSKTADSSQVVFRCNTTAAPELKGSHGWCGTKLKLNRAQELVTYTYNMTVATSISPPKAEAGFSCVGTETENNYCCSKETFDSKATDRYQIIQASTFDTSCSVVAGMPPTSNH